MVKIAICDDDEPVVHKNESLVKACMLELNTAVNVAVYTQIDNLLYDMMEDKKYFDLILLDIEMPGCSGMEAAKQISTKYPNVKIIFITSHLEYAIDAFELSIFRYIPKGDSTERLQHAVKDAVSLILIEGEQEYQISNNNRYERIPYRSIMYIKRDGKNAVIVTQSGETKVRKTLQAVYDELHAEEFIYIDRGMIVNLIYIMKVVDGMAYLKNGEMLAVSRSHLMEVRHLLNTYWGEHI